MFPGKEKSMCSDLKEKCGSRNYKKFHVVKCMGNTVKEGVRGWQGLAL